MNKLFCLICCLLYSLSLNAFPLDEQIIPTQDGSCKLHYLSNKTKKLWTIDVNKSYCQNGWVQGFATVVVKDQLNRTTETLKGYFYSGYWIADYTRDIKTFYRSAPAHQVQSFIFPIQEDEDLNAIYLADARSVQKDNTPYPPFQVCGENPYLLIAHKETEDFRKSLFQSVLLKNAKVQAKKLCPKAQKFSFLGVKNLDSTEADWVFRADIDLQTDESTIHYPPDPTEMPHPTEIRHEQGENLLTITPREKAPPTVSYKETLPVPLPAQENSTQLEKLTIPWDDLKTIRSAIDLDLMARVLPDGAAGKTIVHIDSVQLDQSAHVDLPTPLVLEQADHLSPGWYTIVGHFRLQNGQVRVKLFRTEPCKKERCADAF